MAGINTTIHMTSTPLSYHEEYNRAHDLYIQLNKIALPYKLLIGFIGLITNTSTVILLSQNYITKNLRNKWTLIALALSDLLFNITLLANVIHDISKIRSHPFCLSISFLSNMAELLSAWYTVSFTIQRYSAVHNPLEAVAHRRSSPIISLLIIFILSSIYCFLSSHFNPYEDCQEVLTMHWNIADILSSFIIPFSLILICNILIVNFIRKHSFSPISFQSTLSRKQKLLHHYQNTYNRDDITDTNPLTNISNAYVHFDGNDNIEIRCHKEENQLPCELENRIYRPSISSSLDHANSDASSNHRQFQPTSHSIALSKKKSSTQKKSSMDSFSNRLSGKSSVQSNDNDRVPRISTRTFQSIRVTRMLVLVSTCFLILNAPAHLCTIAIQVYPMLAPPTVYNNSASRHDQETQNLTYNRINNGTMSSSLLHGKTTIQGNEAIYLLYIAVQITQYIAYASYSVNFFLYSFSGIAFRTSLRQLINKFRRY